MVIGWKPPIPELSLSDDLPAALDSSALVAAGRSTRN